MRCTARLQRTTRPLCGVAGRRAHAGHACSTASGKACCTALSNHSIISATQRVNLLQAIIEGFDISRDMDSVYALMGACPQHDLLWDGLTGEQPVGAP